MGEGGAGRRGEVVRSDVVVVGSGAAGLAAALAAATAGATVTVLEGSARWGGATAVSGGQVWIPANGRLLDRGEQDSPADALVYLVDRTLGRDPSQLAAFVDAAPPTLDFLEAHTPLRFQCLEAPDSFAEAPGARVRGRNLEPLPVALDDLGDPETIFWPPPMFAPVLTHAEVAAHGLLSGGTPPAELMARRREAGMVTMGRALIAGLLHGCRAAGVELWRECPVVALETGGVAGATTAGALEVRSADVTWRADRAVVLATGGFDHDPGLCDRLLPGAPRARYGPPIAARTAVELAGSQGAALVHLDEVWTWPATQPPTTCWPDGTPRPAMVVSERMLPHTVWVNGAGRRFVDESSHNAGLALSEIDPASGRPRNHPAWAIADAAHRTRYGFGGAAPADPLPGHVVEAATLEDLADAIGIAPAALVATVRRFNADAARGVDPDFGRGESTYDRYWGDAGAGHPNLAPVARPPFVALPLVAGVIGTKGGPRTDSRARVLRWDGEPIDGLYAAGNAMGVPIGPATPSAGATIGSAVTWGRIAGTDAAGRG